MDPPINMTAIDKILEMPEANLMVLDETCDLGVSIE